MVFGLLESDATQGLEYENTCTASKKYYVFEYIPRLCRLRIFWWLQLWDLNQKTQKQFPGECNFKLWSLCSKPIGGLKFYFICWGTLVIWEPYVVLIRGLAGIVSICSSFYLRKWRRGVKPWFQLFVSGVNQRNDEVRWGVWSFSSTPQVFPQLHHKV